MSLTSKAAIRSAILYRPPTTLVTHADHALGRHVATQLLGSGENVRIHAAQQHPARVQRLRRAGADALASDQSLSEPANPAVWHGVGSVVHASASGASWGKEAVVSVSDLGVQSLVQAAAEVSVQNFVLLHPPSPEIRTQLERSALPYTLLCPETQDLVAFSDGARGRLLERRRQVVFMPLLRVAAALIRAASGGFERMTLTLPTVVRRYDEVLDDIERFVSLPETPVADPLLAELVMGSPYKLVTPGVARALGLEFPKRYLEGVLSASEG